MIADDVEVREAGPDDVLAFECLFRPGDEALCRERIGVDAMQAAVVLWKLSPVVFAAFSRGRPAALFGAVAVQGVDGVGVPWLLRTPEADARPVTMAKVAKKFLPRLNEAFPVLRDAPLIGDGVVRRWLSWLGFSESMADRGHVVMERGR
jgi:hypothetical protein